MKNSLTQHTQIALHLFIFALVLVAGSFIAHQQQSSVREQIQDEVLKQEKYMLELAESTDRNEADSETNNIITDCGRRAEFESLLLRLGSLSKQEMLSLQSLFESCGGFHATQKAIMISKLKQAFKNYESNIRIYDTLGDAVDITRNKDSFSQILMLEEQRTSLLKDQEDIQSKIISNLISGRNVNGKEVTDLMLRAQDIADLLLVTDQKIDQIRDEVVI